MTTTISNNNVITPVLLNEAPPISLEGTSSQQDPFIPHGMSQEELDNLIATGSPEELKEFWQSLTPEEVDAFLQTASIGEIDSYLMYMSQTQFVLFLSKANSYEQLYALIHTSEANRQFLWNPPEPMSNEYIQSVFASLTPEEEETLAQLQVLAKATLQGDYRSAAQTSAEAMELVQSMYQYDIPYEHLDFWGLSLSFIEWVNSINNLATSVAQFGAILAEAGAATAQYESTKMMDAQTGDAWVDAWKNDQASKHPGTGWETDYYTPGIDNIPPSAMVDNTNVSGYWESNFSSNMTQIQTSIGGWNTQLQGWTTSETDLVQNMLQNILNDWANINNLSAIYSNMATLLRS